MIQGTVKRFSDESGYRFIRPDEGGENLYVRRSDVAASNVHESLEKGDEVNYERTQGGKGLQATNVSRRRRYSWREDCLERHQGKERRAKSTTRACNMVNVLLHTRKSAQPPRGPKSARRHSPEVSSRVRGNTVQAALLGVAFGCLVGLVLQVGAVVVPY